MGATANSLTLNPIYYSLRTSPFMVKAPTEVEQQIHVSVLSTRHLNAALVEPENEACKHITLQYMKR